MKDSSGTQVATETAIRELIIAAMPDLVSASNVFVRSEDEPIGNDLENYVSIGVVDAKTISNTQEWVDNSQGLTENLYQVMAESVQIDFFGRSSFINFIRGRFLAALKSYNAQNIQEKYQFRIAPVPVSITQAPTQEGGSMIKRLTVVLVATVWYSYTVDHTTDGFYDDFNIRVDDEQTIGTAAGAVEIEEKAQ